MKFPKYNYLNLIFILFLINSCSSIKIKELNFDSTQELKGKVKKIVVNSEYYGLPTNKAKIIKENNIFYFDKNNRISKQMDSFNGEIEYNYVNGNLDNLVRKSKIGISKTLYKYDKNKNNIEINEFQNDTLFFIKKSVFDSKNHITKSSYIHPQSTYLDSNEKITHNLKNNFFIVQTYDHNDKLNEGYLKLTYNKSGNIIKSETIHKDYNTTSTLTYDKFGNLVINHILNIKSKQNEYITFKNKYDEMGNIILREKFSNNKLIMKTTYEITYW